MLLILAVAALFAAIALGVRWSLNRVDTLGRPRHFPVIGISLLATLALILAWPTFARHREEAKLGKVASVLVGAPATVHCQTFGQTFTDTSGDLGYVKFGPDGVPERHTSIMRGPCAEIKAYYNGDQEHPTLDEIIAVHVLTHESMHMRGQPVEALTECEAVQRDALTAQLLGASPLEAIELARAYWLRVYPDMPDAYRTGDCSPDGPLDEHLPDPPWSRGDYVPVKLPAG